MASVDEVSFAKSFLNLVDSKPIKLQNDYRANLQCSDISSLVNAFPVLERKQKRNSKEILGATVFIKSLRPPVVSLTFTDLPLTTTIYTLKLKISEKSGLQNIKLLTKGKVLNDGKTVGDIVDSTRKATLHVMGMPQAEEKQVEQGEFLTELKLFLTEKLTEEKTNKVLDAVSTIQDIKKW